MSPVAAAAKADHKNAKLGVGRAAGSYIERAPVVCLAGTFADLPKPPPEGKDCKRPTKLKYDADHPVCVDLHQSWSTFSAASKT